jgi:NAD(P)-dependent dehydrogenase (short-subunit alcohol dehydrogenase family)
MINLEGRIALVTGAAQADGIGQGIVTALLRGGAAGVLFTDIDTAAAARSLAIAVAEFGPDRVAFSEHDVSSPEDWQRAAATVSERFGGLDILVNNAGASFDGTIATATLEQFRRGMSVNFESQFIGMQTCLPALAERASRWAGGTAVVNNSSVGAYLPDPTNLIYNTSKAAGRMLSMCAARELGGRGIRVNSIHLGTIDTPLLRASFQRRVEAGQYPDVDAARAGLASRSILKSIGTPADVGALVAFLASDDARYITGSAYIADGGLTNQY